MIATEKRTTLRASELVGPQWNDFDWENRHVTIQREVVIGRVGEVKTRHLNRAIPLDPGLASILLSYKRQAGASDWVFPSTRTGRPWWPWTIQRTHLIPAGMKAGLGRIGWHTFRHSYSTMLRALKLDVKVQQELPRHADIRTTLNIYTQAGSRSSAQRKQQSGSNGAAKDENGMKETRGQSVDSKGALALLCVISKALRFLVTPLDSD